MSVKITDKITQMNGQNYPLMDASAVEYTKPDGTKCRVNDYLNSLSSGDSSGGSGIYKP